MPDDALQDTRVKRAAGYDYVVVGGGSAGCALAARLADGGTARVLLLEAGPRDRHPYLSIPLGVGMIHARGMFDWGLKSEPEPGLDRRVLHAIRGKVLGGSSSVNVMGFTRGDRSDFDRWARNGADGWSFQEVLPYFRRLERWQGGGSALRGGDGPVAVEAATLDDPLAEAWRQAFLESGLPENPDLCSGEMEGFGATQFTIDKGRRASSSRAYLAAGAPANLTIVTGARVTRIRIRNARAVGVDYIRAGRRERADAAGEVVLAAGAFHSPQLLMLSGIGPAAHLRGHGIRVVADLPVGDNLQDHMAAVNLYRRRSPGPFQRRMRLDRMAAGIASAWLFGTGFATRIPSGTLAFLRATAEAASPDLEFMFPISPPDARLWFPGWRRPYPDAFGIRPAILHPRSRGAVTLRSRDPAASPRIQFNALTDPADIALLRAGLERGRDIAARPALDPFRGEELAPGAHVAGAIALERYLRATAITVNHPCGTCAIGAVLDPALRVHGIKGLRVVDASAMPDLVSGHINAAVLMMAERASDLILADK